MEVTAVFDIGKTNKKFFLFDENYQEVFKTYEEFEETTDEDGFPCDDIFALTKWVKTTFQQALNHPNFEIRAVNCSAYGASFVHLNEDGDIIAPLYNYLKPFPEAIATAFYTKYGSITELATETASPPLGMLNSGLQLFWLKHTKPDLFRKIRWSLHLPQYLSYLLSGVPISDYTSIGCHTMLWDYTKNDYHHWVYQEGIDQILAPIVATDQINQRKIEGKTIRVGAGIHDSSAALLPYRIISEDHFITLSTGTWSIALNPFNQEGLSAEELEQDCLNFLSTDGKMVKAARLFLGNEYKVWTKQLALFFKQPIDLHKSIQPDDTLLKQLDTFPKQVFKWVNILSEKNEVAATDLSQFNTYEMAYHKLMQELSQLQLAALALAKGKTSINKIYIDGGFIDNKLFIHFLTKGLPKAKLLATKTPLGSAIGAAIVLDKPQKVSKVLSQHFNHPNP
ncbi:MAG: hypothetical protein Sapg2KO_23360 [Saprospiraceae bacterium]